MKRREIMSCVYRYTEIAVDHFGRRILQAVGKYAPIVLVTEDKDIQRHILSTQLVVKILVVR